LDAISGVAKRTIAVDAVVPGLAAVRSGKSRGIMERLVDRNKSVSGMDEVGILEASSTEVPIRAVQTLVANTVDVLVTSIADGIVSNISAGSEKSLGNQIEVCLFNSWLKCVLRVMTMLHADVAGDTKVIVGTRGASNEVLFREFLDA